MLSFHAKLLSFQPVSRFVSRDPLASANSPREQLADAVCPSVHTPREMSGRTAIRPMVGHAALLIVEGDLRRRVAHLNLRAHLLQARSKRFNLLLLLREVVL